MKNFILLFLLFCGSCAHQQQFVSTGSNILPYKITKIENNNILYTIHAQRNDSTFKILSLINSLDADLKPIEIGKKYQLDLMKIYPNDLIRKRYDEARQDVQEYVLFGRDKKTHFSLYVATNLNGLNVSNDQQRRENVIDRFSYVEIMPNHVKTKRSFKNMLMLKKGGLNMIVYIKSPTISDI